MDPQIRIIDNKRILLTQEEWDYYQSICKSYDKQNFKGEDLFKGLFESNNEGIITFIKPPSSKYTSMEVFLYIVAIFQHQHMRLMYKQLQSLVKEVKTLKEKKD